ncbi:MAG: hypothetical protein Q7S21_02145 [archaeon]|nr:hypothetical protein [archaeon]
MAFSAFDILLAVFGFLRGIFLISIVIFLLSLVGVKLFNYLRKRHEFSWFKAVLLASFLEIFVLTAIVYFFPAYLGYSQQSYGILPPELQPTLIENLLFFAGIFLRVIIVSIVLSIFLLPLEFVGSYVFEKLNQKLPYFLRQFIAVFAATLVGGICVFLLFPWIILGILQLLFFV